MGKREALCSTSPRLRGEVGLRVKRESRVRGRPSSGSQDAHHLLPAGGEKEREPDYFFFVSAAGGFAASGVAASGFAGVLAAWSMRSILAPSRSFAT